MVATRASNPDTALLTGAAYVPSPMDTSMLTSQLVVLGFTGVMVAYWWYVLVPGARVNLAVNKRSGRLRDYLEELKGDDPTIWGYDYYHVIYATAGFLAVIMLYLYFIIEDIAVRQMVMLQGAFSIGLLVTSMYFRKRLQQTKLERALAKKAQEERTKKQTKRKRR